jgi:hypothetical protein
MPLTDDERKQMEAAAREEDDSLDEELKRAQSLLDGTLDVPNAAEIEPSDRDELNKLITSIKNGTASNNQRARFLEILNRFAS